MSKFVVFTSDTCPWCDKVKSLLTEQGHTYTEININEHLETASSIMSKFGLKTVPQVLELIGGYEATAAALEPR